jgi:AraC family transcriptional regulator
VNSELAEQSAIDLYRNEVARRFRTETVKTVFANTVSRDPIAISNIILPEPSGRWTETPRPESGFSIHVVMAPVQRVQTLIEGRQTKLDPFATGDICLFDLSVSPIVLIEDPMDSMRIQISNRTLDELAYDRGRRPVGGLRPTFGGHDPVLHGLCLAFQFRLKIYGDSDALFLDHAALAFHAHVAEVYGQLRCGQCDRGGLAPWQLRRVRDLMMARLPEGVTIAELASACGLSVSYFSRAFRRSTGGTAHRWLMDQRIERAKTLLLQNDLPVVEVALACGFTDQSHLTRAFLVKEGQTPGRWRRLRRA